MLCRARFDGARLSTVNLTRADLSGADLLTADLGLLWLSGCHTDDRTRWPAGLTPPPSPPVLSARQLPLFSTG